MSRIYFNPRSPYGERRFARRCCQAVEHFNPRSPYGERLDLAIFAPLDCYFNPRSPYGERLCKSFAKARGFRYFNPRSPYGERHDNSVAGDATKTFQSTLPVRGATMYAYPAIEQFPISIHAPRTGSDRVCANQSLPFIKFQSTLPVRGATRSLCFAGR